MKTKKETRGGYRPNAGRPKGEETRTISVRVPSIHYDFLKNKIAKIIADLKK